MSGYLHILDKEKMTKDEIEFLSYYCANLYTHKMFDKEVITLYEDEDDRDLFVDDENDKKDVRKVMGIIQKYEIAEWIIWE